MSICNQLKKGREIKGGGGRKKRKEKVERVREKRGHEKETGKIENILLSDY